MRSSSWRKSDQRVFIEQVRECMNNGYLLSSKKIGSGAFSKVYLAYATRERMKHNPRLSSDLRGKRHTMVRQACHLLCGFLGVTLAWFHSRMDPGSCPNLSRVPSSSPSFLYRTSLLGPISSQLPNALSPNPSNIYVPRTKSAAGTFLPRILLAQPRGEVEQYV